MADTEDTDTPAEQVADLCWVNIADLYNDPDAVLARLRVMVEATEVLMQERRVPGSVILGVRTVITTADLPTPLKG